VKTKRWKLHELAQGLWEQASRRDYRPPLDFKPDSLGHSDAVTGKFRPLFQKLR
jgi:hypothetical protein